LLVLVTKVVMMPVEISTSLGLLILPYPTIYSMMMINQISPSLDIIETVQHGDRGHGCLYEKK